MTPAKKSTGSKGAASRKAAPKKAAAKKAGPRRPAQPEALHLRRGEKYVVIDGANIRHIADTNSAGWETFGTPICGARPPANTVFVDTAAKLPVCDNCKAVW